MDLNKAQQDHFQQGLDQISSDLSTKNRLVPINKKNEVIEKAKHDLLDLFLDDTLGLENHEQVDKAFDHVQALLTDKIQEANNEITQATTEVEKAKSETKKNDFLTLRRSAQRSQRNYKPEKFEGTKDLKGRMGQVKELYEKIAKISNDTKGNPETTPIPQADITHPEQGEGIPAQQEGVGSFVTPPLPPEEISDKEKEETPLSPPLPAPEQEKQENYLDTILRQAQQLKNLKEQFPELQNNEELLKQINEGKKISLKDKNGVDFIISKDGDNYYAAEASGDSPRGEIDPPTPLTTKKVVEYTSNEIHNLFTIDANVMDKENLIEESERNRIKDLSERKYMESNWLQKVGMFGINRRKQKRNLEKSMKDQKNKSNFIEQGTLQDRIDGNIGTYATQSQVGIAGNTINRKEIASDNEIDRIAHNFLMGTISKESAISEFNRAFNENHNLRMGNMTGTDIMAQLGDAKFQQTYKIKQLLLDVVKDKKTQLSDTDIVSIQQQFNSNKPNIVGDTLQTNTIVSAEEIKSTFESLKSDLVSHNIQDITDNTTKIRVKLRTITKQRNTEELEGVRYDSLEQKRREKVAKFFHRGSGASMGAKAGLGVGLGLAGAPVLGVVAGVTSLGMLLQRAKTRRDTIKEIAKTHEDAINMGMGELENRISALLKAKDDAAGWRHKAFNFFGFGSYHRTLKQLKILESFEQMRTKGTIVSVQKIINDLNHITPENLKPLGETLARIDAGQQYQTHFISTTDINGKSLGRSQTAIKRNEMMKALQQACIRMGLATENMSDSEWKQVRGKVSKNESYQSTAKNLSESYAQAQQDIIHNKGAIARNAAAGYAKTALAASGVAALAGGIIHGLNSTDTAPEVLKEIKPHEHTNYKIGKFDDHGIVHKTQTSGLDQVHNGQTIEIQGESAVDGIKAHSDNSFGNYMDHIKETRELVSHSGLNKVTQETLQHAVSDEKINEIMKLAKDSGADIGNQRLAAERWREGMENITEYLSSHNMKNVTIKDIVFDPESSRMAIQSSNGQEYTRHRGFEAIVKILEPKTNTVKDSTRSFPWGGAGRIPAALPFANTYALPGEKSDFASLSPQAVEKRRRRWQLRKKETQLGKSRWENRHAA